MSKKMVVDFDLVKQYCGQDLSFRLQGAINNLFDSEIKIVNTGMVSSGKSSLYNVLTENTEEERFPTGAARTTTIADSFHYKNLLYIDTPGIDVKDIDDEIAFGTIMKADIVIIVHNIKTGPLTRGEYDWIRRIADAMPNEEARKKRMLLVCTWKDMREKEEEYETILSEVCNMVFSAVGTEISVCDVSVLKYQNGIKKNKPLLCEKSGIPELKSIIEIMVKDYAAIKVRYARAHYENVVREVIGILRSKKNEKQNIIYQKKNKVAQRYRSERNSWSNIFQYFSSIRDNLKRLQCELNDI